MKITLEMSIKLFERKLFGFTLNYFSKNIDKIGKSFLVVFKSFDRIFNLEFAGI